MSTVSSFSSSTVNYNATSQTQSVDGSSKRDEVKKAFDQLKTALQNGDLNAAKSAYETLQKDKPTNQSGTQSNTNGTDEMDSLMNSLGSALNSGDLSSAQDVFSQIQEKIKAGKPGQAGSTQTSATDSDDSTSSSTSLLDTTA